MSFWWTIVVGALVLVAVYLYNRLRRGSGIRVRSRSSLSRDGVVGSLVRDGSSSQSLVFRGKLKGGPGRGKSPLVRQSSSGFKVFPDVYDSIEKVQKALRTAGLEDSNLILAIDYTKSNEYTGTQSFGGKCLHEIQKGVPNPYQQVIGIVGRTLAEFDDDQLIPTFGFGDATTKNLNAFPFYTDKVPYTVEGVLRRYNEITPGIVLDGPTNFAPVINSAVKIVKKKNSFHILVIIADGQVTDEIDTIDAIVHASHYPLSIIMVGVGDGPWDLMKQFDDELPQRKFDNFQFVDFNKVRREGRHGDASFACAALQEVPQQYKHLVQLGMVKTSSQD